MSPGADDGTRLLGLAAIGPEAGAAEAWRAWRATHPLDEIAGETLGLVPSILSRLAGTPAMAGTDATRLGGVTRYVLVSNHERLRRPGGEGSDVLLGPLALDPGSGATLSRYLTRDVRLPAWLLRRVRAAARPVEIAGIGCLRPSPADQLVLACGPWSTFSAPEPVRAALGIAAVLGLLSVRSSELLESSRRLRGRARVVTALAEARTRWGVDTRGLDLTGSASRRQLATDQVRDAVVDASARLRRRLW